MVGYWSSLFFGLIILIDFSRSFTQLTFHDASLEPAAAPRHGRGDSYLVFTFAFTAALRALHL
jgi:hypothetical protein